MSELELPAGLTQIAMALMQDKALREWFEALAIETPAVRALEFRKTAARMGESEDHRQLSHALGLLAAPGMYEAVLEALAELEG